MKPGSEAIGEETVEIVAAVVEAKEAMVTAVEMLECLGKKDSEVDRAAAVRFFSDALAEGDENGALPLHSPGHLPGLVQLLKDCVREMSKAFQDKTILAINRLIYHYVHILEPTETEMTSLEDAIEALDNYLEGKPDFHHISQVLPTILGIYQEPENRKEAQLHAAACLARLPWRHDEAIESSVMKVMMETVRVGKASPDVQILTIFAISKVIQRADDSVSESWLQSGLLEATEQVLKRPGHTLERVWHDAWTYAAECLNVLSTRFQEQVLNGILSSGGLMEHMLEMGGMGLPEPPLGYCDGGYSYQLIRLITEIASAGSESQLRRLMSKASFFRVLALHLNSGHDMWQDDILDMVEKYMMASGTEHELWLRRRLIDDTGITDAIHLASRKGSGNPEKARHIIDTYLKNPLPPRPISNLPSIIYTKNVPQ